MTEKELLNLIIGEIVVSTTFVGSGIRYGEVSLVIPPNSCITILSKSKKTFPFDLYDDTFEIDVLTDDGFVANKFRFYPYEIEKLIMKNHDNL